MLNPILHRTIAIAGIALAVVAADPSRAVSSFSPEPGVIQGRVVDRAGQSLPGVAVTVRDVGLSAVTDDEGRFVVAPIPPGVHRLRFTPTSHHAAEVEVEVLAGETATIEVALERVSFGDRITVRAASRRIQRIALARTPSSASAPGYLEGPLDQALRALR